MCRTDPLAGYLAAIWGAGESTQATLPGRHHAGSDNRHNHHRTLVMPKDCLVRSAYRSILIADIEGYTARHRDDDTRSRLRATLRQNIAYALRGAGIDAGQYASQTTGDGLLVTIDPAIGKPRILGPVIDALTTGLCEHNRFADLAEELRIRVVVHAGDLLFDPDGPLGEQMNFAFRMLCAQRFRTLLTLAEGPLLICVSDVVYRQVVAQRHEGLDPSGFEAVLFDGKDFREIGWVRAPGEPGLVARSGLPPPRWVDGRDPFAIRLKK
jgi:class 3 adenylate cyclase